MLRGRQSICSEDNCVTVFSVSPRFLRGGVRDPSLLVHHGDC